MEGATVFMEEGAEGATVARLQTINDYYQARTTLVPGDQITPYRPLSPELLYWTAQDWGEFLDRTPWSKVTPFQVDDLSLKVPVQDFKGKTLHDFGITQSTARSKAFEILRHRNG